MVLALKCRQVPHCATRDTVKVSTALAPGFVAACDDPRCVHNFATKALCACLRTHLVQSTLLGLGFDGTMGDLLWFSVFGARVCATFEPCLAFRFIRLFVPAASADIYANKLASRCALLGWLAGAYQGDARACILTLQVCNPSNPSLTP